MHDDDSTCNLPGPTFADAEDAENEGEQQEEEEEASEEGEQSYKNTNKIISLSAIHSYMQTLC